MSWWRRGVLYEIYPRSFQDSDGDGVGDLRGIAARLPYLRALGVDAIWLTPIYASPQADFGYDISDHTAIDPLYGSLHDFDALVAAAHARDVRVLLDYVPNHTSTSTSGSASGPTSTTGATSRTTGAPCSAGRHGSGPATVTTCTPTCASSPT